VRECFKNGIGYMKAVQEDWFLVMLFKIDQLVCDAYMEY
jgi:hypothetical protein